jgi:hypothetical protein
MSAPTGTPTPMPAFAPAEREAEDVVGAVVVGEGVENVAGIVVEIKDAEDAGVLELELEVDVPTIPMVVNATTPPSKVVILTPVVQLQADG